MLIYPKNNAHLPLGASSGLSHGNYICYEARRLWELYCDRGVSAAYTSVGGGAGLFWKSGEGLMQNVVASRGLRPPRAMVHTDPQ